MILISRNQENSPLVFNLLKEALASYWEVKVVKAIRHYLSFLSQWQKTKAPEHTVPKCTLRLGAGLCFSFFLVWNPMKPKSWRVGSWWADTDGTLHQKVKPLFLSMRMVLALQTQKSSCYYMMINLFWKAFHPEVLLSKSLWHSCHHNNFQNLFWKNDFRICSERMVFSVFWE